MPANKMPEMPEYLDSLSGSQRYLASEYGHACYLAGIDAARSSVSGFPDAWRGFARTAPADQSDESVTFWHGHSEGLKDCASELEATLTNLTALEQEAKK